jgi:hypothetical protein
MYTLTALGQEKFEDVIVPPEPTPSAQTIQSQNQATAVQAKIPTGNVNGMRS